ncbi:MAG TPA: Stp1/IreP family PP2C-type Ser/Thr phosphatase [bacterium]|nr:Stp1/IreP family PP2C-type Ser/Thr phosphatase [bacterium]
MKITVCARTDVGRKRAENQDHFLVDEEHDLFVVADGVGGYAGGEVASELAVTTIEEVLARVAASAANDAEDLVRAEQSLALALRVASARIHARAGGEPSLSNMATTAVAMRFLHDHVVLANVGDSRGYRIRDGVITQLTRDHSLVAEQLRAGVISAEQARTHRMRNLILRSLGTEADVIVDTFVFPVREGDYLLLCSDGLSGMVEDLEIRGIVEGSLTVEAAAERLVERANDHGGDDNVTVVLARVDALDRDEDEKTDTSEIPTPTPA